jgi:hypothetical protein
MKLQKSVVARGLAYHEELLDFIAVKSFNAYQNCQA